MIVHLPDIFLLVLSAGKSLQAICLQGFAFRQVAIELGLFLISYLLFRRSLSGLFLINYLLFRRSLSLVLRLETVFFYGVCEGFGGADEYADFLGTGYAGLS